MLSVDQIRNQVRAVINNDMELDAFDEWLSEHSWNMHKDSPSNAVKLVGKIESLLSNFDDGRISMEALIHEFKVLSPIFEQTHGLITGLNGDLVSKKFEWSVASDKRSSVGFSYTPLFQGSR